MSILIKGMELPKNCNQCLINCEHSQLYIGIKDKRADECPLIEIPPHGRLIDADAFYKLIDGGYDLDFDEVPETKQELLRMIIDAPTVIEAEGE